MKENLITITVGWIIGFYLSILIYSDMGMQDAFKMSYFTAMFAICVYFFVIRRGDK